MTRLSSTRVYMQTIARMMRHSTEYVHTLRLQWNLSQCRYEVFLRHTVNPLVNPAGTQSSAAEICPVPPCIWCVLIVLFRTAVLTVRRDCNTEQQQQQRERERERNREWWVVNELSLAFFSLMWLQHAARFEHWIVRQRVHVHVHILGVQACVSVLVHTCNSV